MDNKQIYKNKFGKWLVISIALFVAGIISIVKSDMNIYAMIFVAVVFLLSLIPTIKFYLKLKKF